jgi:LytS/YehU family sensor histidine kinase
MLRLAQIARQRTETLRTEAELDSLQGKIDPHFLLRVMVETKRRYDTDPAGATRLVDTLVRFLRAAMACAAAHQRLPPKCSWPTSTHASGQSSSRRARPG